MTCSSLRLSLEWEYFSLVFSRWHTGKRSKCVISYHIDVIPSVQEVIIENFAKTIKSEYLVD